MTSSDAIREFLISRGGTRPKTVHWYRDIFIRFQRDFPGELPQSPQAIQGWLNSLQHLSPERVHGYFRALRALYRQTHRWHPRLKDPIPLVNPPVLHDKVMRTFTMQELSRLLALPLSPRDRCLITFLLDTGARAGESANLTWENVMPEFAIVSGKRGERVIPLSAQTYHLLQHLHPGQGRVFLGKRGPLTEEGVYKVVRQACARAGVVGKRCSPQTFRHTFGTEYAGTDGCDPQALQSIMGHRDNKTTTRYIHTSMKRIIGNHQRCTPLRALAAAAQGALLPDEVVEQAESIMRSVRS